MEEVYWNDSKYEYEGERNRGAEQKNLEVCGSVECTGIELELIGRVE